MAPVSSLADPLVSLVGPFDGDWPTVLPDLAGIPSERLEADICSLAAHLDAALCRWLVLVAEFDRREGWASWETRSCAQWLSWKCGISQTTANEHVRVGHALLRRPLIRAAFGRGEISYTKVRAITRIDEPALEAELLDLARASTGAGLDRLVRAYRRHGGGSADDDEAARAFDQRTFVWWFDDDGSFVFHGRLPADLGAVIVQALAAAHDERTRAVSRSLDDDDSASNDDLADDDGPGRPGPEEVVAEPGADARDVGAADDLVHLARRFVGHADELGRRPGHELIVIVDAELLAGADEPDAGASTKRSAADLAGVPRLDDDGLPREPATTTGLPVTMGRTCEVLNGPALSPEVMRRLGCDALIGTAVIDAHGNPLHLGRRHRLVNRRLRRALTVRDRTCQFPGCTRKGHLQAHHLVYWTNGGPTDLDNMVLICEHHHTRVHEGRWLLIGRPGQPLDACHPDGRVMHATPTTPTITDTTIEHAHHELGLTIDHRTNEPEWEGRGPDLNLIIDCLDSTLEQARDATPTGDGTAPIPPADE